MKKIIITAVAAALVLSLGVAAYAANNSRTSQPETTQSEQFSAEAPQMDGEKPSDLPEMNVQPPQMNGKAPSGLPEINGQPPQMNGEKPSGCPDMIDFDAMVKNGVISQETCDKIKAYMEEHKPAGFLKMEGQAPEMNGQPPQMSGEKPADLPDMNGQPPQMNGQPPQMNGEAPSDLPDMNGERPANGGLLNDLLSNGIITQAEYDALDEAITK